MNLKTSQSSKTKKIILPKAVLPFKLLDSSGLDIQDRQLVLTSLDYPVTDT